MAYGKAGGGRCSSSDHDVAQAQIILSLLEAVDRDGEKSQRHLAAELGIALGLVNTYLVRCIRKGLVKARHAPARRYFYYLTPRGLAEKSRLTVQYLSSSFAFFRQAKADCLRLFKTAHDRGLRHLVLAGTSDLAEIAAICAIDSGITIIAVVQPSVSGARFHGMTVFPTFDAIGVPFDAVVVTDLITARETHELAVSLFGIERVLVPDLLRLSSRSLQERDA